MNKKIKGYELYKMIAEEKLKNNVKMVDENGNHWIYNGVDFLIEDPYDVYADIVFAKINFEILEDKEEIEEIKVDDNNYIVTDNGTNLKGRAIDITFVNKINEIIDKVNKLDKKINKED